MQNNNLFISYGKDRIFSVRTLLPNLLTGKLLKVEQGGLSGSPRRRGCRPYSQNGFFIAQSLRYGRAWIVGIIPPSVVQRRGHGSAAGHFKMCTRIYPIHPVPGIVQPITAVGQGLMRKPADLIISPDPVEPAMTLTGLTGCGADAVIIEFYEIRKTLTGPSAGRDPAPGAG